MKYLVRFLKKNNKKKKSYSQKGASITRIFSVRLKFSHHTLDHVLCLSGAEITMQLSIIPSLTLI